MHAARATHVAQNAPEDLHDGSETGMAASTIVRTPMTMQQNVPNMQAAEVAPQTQVVRPLEQGVGRAPGWKWAWMRKNIPYSPDHIQGHMQRNFGPLRAELPLGYDTTRKLNRPGQQIVQHYGKTPPVSLEAPMTQLATVAYPELPTNLGVPWGEPV